MYNDLRDMLADTRAASRKAAKYGFTSIAGDLVAHELRLEHMLSVIANPGTVPERKRTVTYEKTAANAA